MGARGRRAGPRASSLNLMRILRTLVEERRWHSRRLREHGEEETQRPHHRFSKLGRWTSLVLSKLAGKFAVAQYFSI